MSEATPTLSDLLSTAFKYHLAGMHACIPARVRTYDSSKQAVSVQPLIKVGYLDETGERQTQALPIINDVPVVFPGANGFRVTFPIANGDIVLLVFSEASIDKWLAVGGNTPIDPLDDRRFHLSDAIAIPGLRPFSLALEDAPTDRMSIGNDSGPTIEIDDSVIKLGSNSASGYLALKSDVQDLRDALATHIHTGVTTGGGTSGTPSVTLPNPTGTTKVKAE